MSNLSLSEHRKLLVRQLHEVAEWVGFETRNKYQIQSETAQPVAFAAEQQKGILGFLFRQFLGHWRSFEIQVYTPERELALRIRHPFRFWFQRLEVSDASGNHLGAIQQRFSVLYKRFDVQDPRGALAMEVASPLFRLWTFPFKKRGREVARVQKKWGGLLTEGFTDRDTFLVEFIHAELSEQERQLVLAAALFIDLVYFENHANRG
jgi:uncharacterized protein YxjI